MELREWTVAGGLVESPDGLLLVRNRRRWGGHDWSPPGGVIAAGEDLVEGLTREVEEETGIRVREWEGPLYQVSAVAPDMGWHLRCHVFRARSFDGHLGCDDPDGIVTEAAFVPLDECRDLLADSFRWVREPLDEWLDERWTADGPRAFSYRVFGTDPSALRVVRRG